MAIWGTAGFETSTLTSFFRVCCLGDALCCSETFSRFQIVSYKTSMPMERMYRVCECMNVSNCVSLTTNVWELAAPQEGRETTETNTGSRGHHTSDCSLNLIVAEEAMPCLSRNTWKAVCYKFTRLSALLLHLSHKEQPDTTNKQSDDLTSFMSLVCQTCLKDKTQVNFKTASRNIHCKQPVCRPTSWFNFMYLM